MIYRPQGLNPNPNEIINETLPAYVEFKRRMDEKLPGFCLWPAAIQTGKIKKRCPQVWQRISTTMKGNMEICCGTEEILKGPNSNLFECEDSPDILCSIRNPDGHFFVMIFIGMPKIRRGRIFE